MHTLFSNVLFLVSSSQERSLQKIEVFRGGAILESGLLHTSMCVKNVSNPLPPFFTFLLPSPPRIVASGGPGPTRKEKRDVYQ